MGILEIITGFWNEEQGFIEEMLYLSWFDLFDGYLQKMGWPAKYEASVDKVVEERCMEYLLR